MEESFLKPKSRIKWLNERDHNSKYFHRVLNGRQAKMKILFLMTSEGISLSDEQNIILEFLKFYEKFLGTADIDCIGGSMDFFSFPSARLSNSGNAAVSSDWGYH